MKQEHSLTDSQKVIVQNLTTVVANANQAASLYLSQLALSEWEYLDENIADLQFDIEKLNEGFITVISKKKNKKR